MGSSVRNGMVRGPRSGGLTGPGQSRYPQRKFPLTLAAWAEAFPGRPVPAELWGMGEAASPIVGRILGKNLVENQPLLYAQSGDPEPTMYPRRGLEFDTTASTEWAGPADATFGNMAAGGAFSVWLRFRAPDNSTTQRSIVGKGDSGAGVARWLLALAATTGKLILVVNDGTNGLSTTVDTNAYDDGAYHDVIAVIDVPNAQARIHTELESKTGTLSGALLTSLQTVGMAPVVKFKLGATGGNATIAGLRVSYGAFFNAALTASDLAAFRTPQ